MRGKPIDKFVSDQLSVWPLVSANYRALKGVKTRSMDIGGLTVRLQCNPSRIGSSDARTDAETVNSRKCLLCASNRPPQQASIPFEGRKGRRYDIILNPYPIFPGHLVAVRKRHVPQSIWHNFVDMLDLRTDLQAGPQFQSTCISRHVRGIRPLSRMRSTAFFPIPPGIRTSGLWNI